MSQNPWRNFHGPNLGYIMEQYELFLEDPSLVDDSLRELFTNWGAPYVDELVEETTQTPTGIPQAVVFEKMQKLVNVLKLVEDIRTYGHFEADVNPLEKEKRASRFTLEQYSLSENDVREIPVELICPPMKGQLKDGLEALNYLKDLYTGTIGFEFDHLTQKEKEWFLEKIEGQFGVEKFPAERKAEVLRKVNEAEAFEQFIQKMYVGQKRFSVEGLETLVPAVEEVVLASGEAGIENVVISMAHRGRLNVLAHVLGKPYEALLSEFQRSKWEFEDPDYIETAGKTGDVKYHLGAIRKRHVNGNTVTVTLANNPSHLEFVNAVSEGYARAYQDDRTEKGYSKQEINKGLAVAVHGDAAFVGQGINFEALNFSNTEAYGTGGTIHIIANNQIGFTAEDHEGRSTPYASDPAKGFLVPVFHVNADDPEAVLKVIRLSFEYRQTFNKDVVVDLIGYRRLGHNELDEPRQTNPILYQLIDNHPTITQVYKDQLLKEKSMTLKEIEEIEKLTRDQIQAAYDRIDKTPLPVPGIDEITGSDYDELPPVDTTVEKDLLLKMNREMLEWPEGFNVFKKLQRILERRQTVIDEKGKIDWGHAEALAFASILADGTPIRITGEDSERGTFSHRNLVLKDEVNGNKYSPLHTLSTSKASFDIFNSTLSEAGVLAFEYGYSIIAPETLVFWEAQYGDFANGAQVIIDQFITACDSKWGQKSGLVMLLPHGYEGQGPEHSSARVERFLQLAAENNMTVANLSTSAQYFHLLRRQAALLNTKYTRPLVIFTPKSLLRNPEAGAYLEEFTNGAFQPIIEQPGLGKEPDQVERLVFCTGRISIDLSQALNEPSEYSWLDIVRIEELYPFPEKEVAQIINRYRNLKEVVWVQEEPKNMGAYGYMVLKFQDLLPDRLKLSYIGRPEMSSPSEGSPQVHKKEQERIISEVLTRTTESVTV